MSAATALAAAPARAETRPLGIPWFLQASVLGSASITLGLMWDISWHMSIGRDTFWSPPHMLTYLGALLAGVSSAWVIFKTTFAGSPAERAATVRVWGFRGPLGAFFCSWGAGAMLTSAPLDDWWHRAYGLDVKIVSLPHVVLGLGMIGIHLGAMLTAVALQNRAAAEAAPGEAAATRDRRLRDIFIGASAMFLVMLGVMTWEGTGSVSMHSSLCYQVAGAVFPMSLVSTARASKRPWAATLTAAAYTAVYLAMLWVLPLFPAEPRLGPVWRPVTHMVPLEFPLLLIFPAVAIDLLMRRAGRGHDGRLAILLGVAFLAVFLAVQWPWADFLMSPLSRNWVFATDRLPYGVPPNVPQALRVFVRWDGGGAALVRGLGLALVWSIASARIGLFRGDWIARVQR